MLKKYAKTLSGYDIVVIQELLGDGSALTNWIAMQSELAGYDCDTLTDPAGRSGRRHTDRRRHTRRPDGCRSGQESPSVDHIALGHRVMGTHTCIGCNGHDASVRPVTPSP